MFPYVQFALTLFVVGLIVAVPSTVRRVRANESDFRCTLPTIAALATTVITTGVIFTGFMFGAQGIKSEAVTEVRATKVARYIQTNWSIFMGDDKDFDDLASSSETEWWEDNKVALNNGEEKSFTTKAGKEVTVKFSPSNKGAEYYNVDVSYDGKRSNVISGEYKYSGTLSDESRDNWVNDYPTLNMKPVGQKA